MTKQRRSFSAEFKREAAGLVLYQGYSHIEASRSLGVVESALRRWVNQLQQERNGEATVGYMTAQEAHRDISHYLMHRYNWIRPHQFNNGLAPAQAEKKLNVVSGIS